MKKTFFKTCLICVGFITASAVSASALLAKPKWYLKLRQIKLMGTTRPEVEKLFAYPKIKYGYKSAVGNVVEYQLQEGDLSIVYSHGKCTGDSEYGYDVERDVVTDIDMDLKKSVNIHKLGLDLSTFHRSEISDLPGIFCYRNENIGEYFIADEYFRDGSKKIRHLEFYPPEHQESLRCKKSN